MKRTALAPSLLAALIVTGLCGGCAQSGPAAATSTAGGVQRPTSAQKQEFLRTHEYDHVNETWVLKGGGVDPTAPPPDVKSRAEVKAERDDFLSKNRWDNGNSRWIPIDGAPRQLSTLPREQVREETNQFLRTHTYDEKTESWIPK